MTDKILETCTHCFESVPVTNGLTDYHDFPKPCRAVCRGAKHLSIEGVGRTPTVFQSLVAEYLGEAEGNALKMTEHFEALGKGWPSRLADGRANPRPRTKASIVRWILEQQRAERYGQNSSKL